METITKKVCRFLGRLSLTIKIIVVTVLVGAVVWLSSDYFIGLTVERVFEDHLVNMMNEEALDARNSFDGFIKSHAQAVRLITAQKRFLDYIDGSEWTDGGSFRVKHEMSLPGWLPRPSVLRQFVHIRYAFLLDPKGRVREVYQGAPETPPEALLHPSVLLRKLSHNQSLMTTLGGRPFLVASDSILTHTGRARATLMIASPLDEQFLVASQRPSAQKRLVALVSPDKNLVLVSNRSDLLPAGARIDELEEDYLVTGKGFFDYGSSDLALGFATFIPKGEIEALSRPILRSERLEHTVTAALFILSFTLIILWVTKRIGRLTGRVEAFSREALGGKPQVSERGDQLYVLEGRFQRLTEEVIRSKEELERRVDERTSELRESEDSLRTLAQNLPGIVYRVFLDEGNKMQFFNEMVRPMTGFTAEELAKGEVCSIESLILPEDREHVVETVKRAVAEDQHFQVEYRLRDKQGEIRHFLERGRPVRGTDGNPSHIDGVILDITVRKLAEEERKKLVITLNTLVEHLPEGVLLLNGEDRIMLANPVAEEYLKSISGAGVGDSLSRIAERPVRELLVSPPHILWHDIEVGGRIFEVAGRALGAEQEAEGIVFVLRDVTEDRQLGGRIQLQERLAAVGQLAAGIAHDFNNILTIINGYAEVLLTDMQMSEEVRQGVDAILQSGRKAADLIHQILDFSRRTVEEMEPVSLVPFVKEFLRFIERTIPENIHISLGYDPSEYVVTADLTKLQQVLANLVVNARDAMPEGGKLKLSLSRLLVGPHERPPLPDMPEGEWVGLSVSDTGKGIPFDVFPHIYEPFFSTKGVGKGTGLGLSQVYGLVKQHKGYIDVKTGERGSTFTVYLPAQEGLKKRPGVSGEAAVPRGKGQTVLVAEDDGAVRDLVRKVLDGLGYRVLTAKNGKEALELFDRHIGEVGLVITDLVMPEIDGIQLSRLLKQKAPSVKVMALSGYALGVDSEELREAGVVELIQKPFKVQTLAREVSSLFEETPTEPEKN